MTIQHLAFGLLALAVGGCSNPLPADQVALQPPIVETVTAITFPNGEAGYAVDCSQASGYCLALASLACPSAFNVVNADFKNTSGLHPRAMDVRCVTNW